jgi:hypothetical protein
MRLTGILLSAAMICFAADTKPKVGKQTTLTGCIDQDGDKFVLTGDRELRKVATLQAPAGVRDDNMFGRHVGHKVTITGVVSDAGESPTVAVKAVKMISETCEPASEK